MAGKRPSVYLSDQSLRFLDGRDGASLSGRINEIIDRYAEILRGVELPPFTDAEIATLMNATMGVVYQPAAMIGNLWQDVADDLVDDLTGTIDPADQALIEKLKGLSFAQQVALLERLELRRGK